MNKKISYHFILIVLVFITSLPLFGSLLYYCYPHDLFYHTQRILSFSQAIKMGQLPVRIYAEAFDGFGYGIPIFYPSLFLYFPAILYIGGVSLVKSYNIFLFSVNVITAIIAFYSFSGILKSKEKGLLATVIYVSSTYRLVDLYTRAAMGETLALAFLPLALYSLFCIKDGERSKWLLLALSFSCVLQSHLLSFVILAGFTIVYALVHIKDFLRINAIINVVKAVILFLLLNGWFLIPLLKNYSLPIIVHQLKGGGAFTTTTASLSQLFDFGVLTATGFETYSNYSLQQGSMPKTPGVVLLLGTALALYYLITHFSRPSDMSEKQRKLWGYVLVGDFFLYMTTVIFPWDFLTKYSFFRSLFGRFQFAWRFNIFAVLFLSLAAAEGFSLLFNSEGKDNKYHLPALCFVIVFSSLFYINSFTASAQLCDENTVLENSTNDKLYVLECSDFAPDSVSYSDSWKTNIIEEKRDYLSTEITFSSDGTYEETIHIPYAYYADYKATLNGQPIEVGYDNRGWTCVDIPVGTTAGTVHVFYEDSSSEKTANVISLLTFLAVIAGTAVSFVSKRRRTK